MPTFSPDAPGSRAGTDPPPPAADPTRAAGQPVRPGGDDLDQPGGQSGPPTSWSEILDRVAESTAATRDALERGAPLPDVLLLPSPPGPLPPELAARARQVLADVQLLEDRCVTVRDGMARLIALVEQHRPAAPAPPAYIDSPA